MPVWPVLIILTAGLTLWGWRHNAWEIPAIAFCGYVAMRLVVNLTPMGYIEVAGCASWLFFAAVMMYRGGEVPGFFYALSALTYPVMLIFGFRMQYMGLSPIIAEAFAALALISIGGGLYGISHPRADSFRALSWVTSHSVGVAMRQENRSIDLP